MDLRSMRAVLPFMGMVIVILVQVSNMFVIKKAISIGINKYVIVVYTDLSCSLIFLLFILITHRLIFPTVTTSVLWKIFLLSLISCSSDFSSYIGLQYSSPTLNTAMLNLIPAFTFILAIIFRMEKLKWRSKSSQAKSLGTIVSIAGAFVVTFYKGPPIVRPRLDIASLDQFQPLQSNWILGGFYLAAQAILISTWYILQAITLKEFPALIVMLCYQYFFSTILAAMFSLTVVTELSAWKLRLDVGLFAIAYSAVIGAAFLTTLLLWCLMRAGPLYVSMFKPLAILFSTVMGVIIFGDGLFLGRMEKLDWKSSSSLAKSVGTIVLITGAFIMTYYKGPHLLMTSSPPNLSLQFFVPQTNWVIGGLLLAIDCVFTSAWLIVQASILKKFSAELIVVFFYCFFVAIQSAILCLVMERDLSSWSLKPGVRLVAVLYSAVFGSAFQVGVCTWCLHRTGPVFVAMFKPLGIVISAAVGTIFLGETVYLGRFIGAAVIVTGFYSVMWGKAKEGNSGVETGVRSLESSSQKDPLLQNNFEET